LLNRSYSSFLVERNDYLHLHLLGDLKLSILVRTKRTIWCFSGDSCTGCHNEVFFFLFMAGWKSCPKSSRFTEL